MIKLKYLTLLILAAACTTETASNTDSAASVADSTPADVTPRDSATIQPPAPAPAESSSASTDPATWTVTVRGMGPISAGMTVAEANAAAGNSLVIPARMEECDFVRFRDGPANVMFMVEKGTISRVDVTRDSRITTEAGAKIGDTEARIKSLYPGVETQPHKYTDGHYLVVTPSGTANQAYRLVFETDGQKVLRYRSGRMPAVQYVESCA